MERKATYAVTVYKGNGTLANIASQKFSFSKVFGKLDSAAVVGHTSAVENCVYIIIFLLAYM